MDRRSFIGTLAGGVLAVPLAANAQQRTNVARIGYLAGGSVESPEGRALLDVLRQGLRAHGYVEGQNLVFEYRSAEGKIERLPVLATELARLKPDLMVAASTAAARAVQQATTTIPVVAFAMTDPVGDGLVASLARPGGNITGLTYLGRELAPKQLALLKEAVPTISRVAALWHPGAIGERTIQEMFTETEAAARTLRVQLRLVGVQGSEELDHAFATMTRERADALIVFPSTTFFNGRRRIVDLAGKHRLPSMYGAREFAEIGGLISYGASQAELARRAAGYVDRILKGAKAGELPVEQPTKFELVVNLKAANALALTIPRSVVLRADEVLQ